MKSNRSWAPSEKRMLGWSSGICLLALAAGGLYEWNNRVPQLQIPRANPPLNNAYDHYARAAKLYVAPIVTRKGMAPDGVIDNYYDGEQPPLYSAAYRARYPLAGQRAFLRANALALGEIKIGLKLDYLQPPERGDKSPDVGAHRVLARLLLIEAHARAQSGDWDGAAQSLLDVHRLGVQTARGGSWRFFRSSLQVRRMMHDDLWLALPHLSAAKARDAARQLENSVSVEPAQALEEEKRAMQSAILELIRKRDWRPLYVSYPCIDIQGNGCDISDEHYQRDLNALPASLKMRLAWMNKTPVLEEYTRCLNWQIARARGPYTPTEPAWPFPESGNDGVRQMTYPQFLARNEFDRITAQERLLTTALALHAYHKENGVYPRNLSQLVPKILARVPLDPYGNGQPLLYAPKTKRYVVSFDVMPDPSGVAAPGAAPPGVPGPGMAMKSVTIYAKQPYTLWSRGLNARDDNGGTCIVPDTTNVRQRYQIIPAMKDTRCDIVAGINH